MSLIGRLAICLAIQNVQNISGSDSILKIVLLNAFAGFSFFPQFTAITPRKNGVPLTKSEGLPC